MGNQPSGGVKREMKQKKDVKFGSYKNSDTPRPGYYSTPTDVYYRGEKMNKCDPKTFKKLGGGWGKDSTNVFFGGRVVGGADTKTFKLDGKFGKDKKGKWYRGKNV